MCTNQRYITNRSLHYDLFKPLKLSVPCGKCEECKRQNRNEWFVRSYYEWLRHDKTNTFFYTLTYNNDNLPLYQGIQHFSKRHIQLFIKRLRKVLSQYDITLKYLITCEFGELRGRCHYHALFFLSTYLNPYIFYKIVRDTWTYGFVKYGENVGLVNSSAGIQYVTKYVTKDYSHLDLVLPKFAPMIFVRYKELYDYLCKRYALSPSISFRMNKDYTFSRVILAKYEKKDEDFAQMFLTKMRRILNQLCPFHLQSTRLGSNISEISDVNKALEQVPVLKQDGKCDIYKMPRYIRRLLWYDVVEGENSGKRDTFVLNEEGKKHMLSMVERQVKEQVSVYESLIVNSTRLHESYLLPLNQLLSTDFKHIRDVVFFLTHFDLDVEVMALYKAVFRGRLCTFDLDYLNAQFVKDNWFDYATACIFDSSEFDYGEICRNYSLQKELSRFLFNNTTFFQPYEFACCLFDTLITLEKKYSNNATFEKEKLVRKIRQYYQSNV